MICELYGVCHIETKEHDQSVLIAPSLKVKTYSDSLYIHGKHNGLLCKLSSVRKLQLSTCNSFSQYLLYKPTFHKAKLLAYETNDKFS